MAKNDPPKRLKYQPNYWGFVRRNTFRRSSGHEKRAERVTALGFRVNTDRWTDMTKSTLLGVLPRGWVVGSAQ